MKKLFIFLTLLTNGVFAQQHHNIAGEVELAGFILGQSRRSIHAELGKPIETRITDDKWLYEFHALHKDTSVYALFKYAAWDTTSVYGIQVNGDHFPEMHTFRGLKLGSKAEEVFSRFGKSNETEVVQDPPLTIHYYNGKNYSFEIDKTGHLYGIQIYGNILSNKASEGVASLQPFKRAIVSKNIDSLLVNISPDVEIYQGKHVYQYSGGARHEFHKPNSEFTKLLLGETNSVWYAFAKEFAEGAGEIKTYDEGKVKATVYKFFDSSVISEIILFPHAGKWKVYEIRFRSSEGH